MDTPEGKEDDNMKVLFKTSCVLIWNDGWNTLHDFGIGMDFKILRILHFVKIKKLPDFQVIANTTNSCRNVCLIAKESGDKWKQCVYKISSNDKTCLLSSDSTNSLSEAKKTSVYHTQFTLKSVNLHGLLQAANRRQKSVVYSSLKWWRFLDELCL